MHIAALDWLGSGRVLSSRDYVQRACSFEILERTWVACGLAGLWLFVGLVEFGCHAGSTGMLVNVSVRYVITICFVYNAKKPYWHAYYSQLFIFRFFKRNPSFADRTITTNWSRLHRYWERTSCSGTWTSTRCSWTITIMCCTNTFLAWPGTDLWHLKTNTLSRMMVWICSESFCDTTIR